MYLELGSKYSFTSDLSTITNCLDEFIRFFPPFLRREFGTYTLQKKKHAILPDFIDFHFYFWKYFGAKCRG